MAKKKASDLMKDVREGLLIIDNALIDHFEIYDPYKRAMLCIRCMESFGDLTSVNEKKIIELIIKTNK